MGRVFCGHDYAVARVLRVASGICIGAAKRIEPSWITYQKGS